MVKVTVLQDCPSDYKEVISAWDYGHWGFRRGYATLESTLAFYDEACASQNHFPYVFVASEKNRPLGMVSLMVEDIHAPHKEGCTPYLVSLYVQERFRHQGIGQALVEHTEQFAKQLGYSKLYAHTRHAQKYLSSLGWEILQEESNKPHEPALHFMMKGLRE